jgi:endogenous inhibitor of DNA gyrase (YacG/DUF329 family)
MTQAKAPACPICRKPAHQDYRPFCSRRCADVDLQRWLSGGYVLPGRADEDESSSAAPGVNGDEED